eukprot:CAMPEP_0174756576 /NCGR_PEP_ID=MMETSP1094-20130205/106824_1 /TAXON_ID=156173 /ORGANISM="Chrysochromulina brevifilum, Strain UTEX LB 985" /LENGTH=443 /DNA_ID=CAMNT_0015962481 /DNA_START=48 /DNA_END=1379 /DNA_ORIENTATION=+
MGCSASKAKFDATSEESRENPYGWSVEKMTDGLKGLETQLHEAETCDLLEFTPLPPPPDDDMLDIMAGDWEFDIFTIPYNELPAFAYNTLISHPSISNKALKINRVKLWHYVCEVARHYHERPFHNFRHAVDVLLATITLIRIISQKDPYPFEDEVMVSCLLISALVHDTGHPGVMNGFLSNIEHPIKKDLKEGTVAILENHHADMALALIKRAELNFLSDMKPLDRKVFLQTLKENVLYTDVSTTMKAAKAWQDAGGCPNAEKKAEDRRPSLSVQDFNRQSSNGGYVDVSQVHCLIIKAADISNPARNLKIYEKWIDGVMTEFVTQGDYERDNGMTISMNCDRHNVTVPKAQVGFITFLVAPLYKALAMYCDKIQPLADQMERNRVYFADLVDKDAAAPAKSKKATFVNKPVAVSEKKTTVEVVPTPSTKNAVNMEQTSNMT